MKAVRVLHEDRIHAAILDGDRYRLVLDPGVDPIEVIATRGWKHLDDAAELEIETDAARVLAPLARPSKILGIGLNYRQHTAEQDAVQPRDPVVFAMFASSVIGPGDAIPVYPITQRTDYEGELGAVIGSRARNVKVEDALSFVAGYTIINDVTARDLQAADVQWVRGKALDGYAPMGPVLVSADEFGSVAGHRIRTEVNGELRQDADTGDLIFDIPTLISYITQGVTLEPGDVIATGTPAGVGHFMDPPRYLRDGDVVSIRIQGIGELVNPVSGTADAHHVVTR